MIRLLAGDCRDVLATLPADSVQCVVTSPPYYGLRDYGTAQWDGGDAVCDHKPAVVRTQMARNDDGQAFRNSTRYRDHEADGAFGRKCGKCGAVRVDRQIGLESSPDEYLAAMVGVFREVRRVMRPDATCWINLGDSFRDKQLLMMPARLALALQADGWWVRSDIIWHKPNPMPESVTDRPTSAHEHVFLLTKSARYFYDADAVREEAEYGRRDWSDTRAVLRRLDEPLGRVVPGSGTVGGGNPASGRNIRNVWTIATAPFPGSHFATMPAAVVERCIKAGTSERGCCGQCGKPWVRVVERGAEATTRAPASVYTGLAYASPQSAPRGPKRNFGESVSTTTGWRAGCDHEAPVVPCTVLDPFAGAGTTLLCADRLQRDAIGIELNTAYTEMAMQRCRDDAPLFADMPPAADPEDARIADLFAEAAE